jgi:aminoglycoside phosphotransferase
VNDLLLTILNRDLGLPARPDKLVEITHGRSGNAVWHAADADVFIKVTDTSDAYRMSEAARELESIRWLDGKAVTPRVLFSQECGSQLFCVLSALSGVPISHLHATDAEAALTATIQELARLHALPIDDCPLDQRTETKLAMAAQRLREGLVDFNDFDDENKGRDPADMLDELRRDAPQIDPVFTHGDASLPNFLWRPGRRVSLLDLGRAGVGDRYQDIGIFLRSALHNYPDIAALPLLEQHYPLNRPDRKMLAYFTLLDEFF